VNGLKPLNTQVPLKDPFLGALVSMLRVQQLPTALLAVAGKKERKDGEVLRGLKVYDQVRKCRLVHVQ
jgi:hypothetical protein